MNQVLLSRLEAFEFDAPGVALPFSHKLASEQNWPADYADRVIREYRRFLYLAATSDTMMSPSPAVDAAWHLHLTHTRSYWGGLCGEVLGQELHHEPSTSGRAESERYQQYYQDTLARYTVEFGGPPPADIWPAQWPVPGARHKRVIGWLLAASVAAAGLFLVAPAFAAPAADSGDDWAAVLIVALPILLIVGLLARAAQNGVHDKRKDDGSGCGGGYGGDGGCDGGGCGGGCGGS